jgi:hypothetical protein
MPENAVVVIIAPRIKVSMTSTLRDDLPASVPLFATFFCVTGLDAFERAEALRVFHIKFTMLEN